MGIRFVLAVLAGGVVASMTDWLFMGDLVYKRFDKHPEIWRFAGGQGESRAIAWSAALPFLTCAVFDFFVRSSASLHEFINLHIGFGALASSCLANDHCERDLDEDCHAACCLVFAWLARQTLRCGTLSDFDLGITARRGKSPSGTRPQTE